jgi:hypothetical protein
MKKAMVLMLLCVGTMLAQASAPNGIAISGGTVQGNPTVNNNGDRNVYVDDAHVGKAISEPAQAAPAKTAIQEKAEFDKQVADAKAAELAEQKKKDDALKNLDNKNPKELNKDSQSLMSAMFSEAMQAQMTLRQAQQQAASFLKAPSDDAAAKTKTLLEFVKELQKSNHAQGCDITPPKIVDKKQVGLQWDCSNAANNVAAEAKQK